MGRNTEAFWASDAGNSYFAYLDGRAEGIPAHRRRILEAPLALIRPVASVLEVGAGTGVTLRSAGELLPGATLGAVEINGAAALRLSAWVPSVWHCSVLKMEPAIGRWDLVLAFGLFSSMAEEDLPGAYEAITRICGRFVLVVDYWAETPDLVSCDNVPYELLREQFATDMARTCPELDLVTESESLEDNFLRWSLLERRD